MGRMGSRAGGCRRHTSFFGSSSCLDGRRARSAARARFLRGTTDGCTSVERRRVLWWCGRTGACGRRRRAIQKEEPAVLGAPDATAMEAIRRRPSLPPIAGSGAASHGGQSSRGVTGRRAAGLRRARMRAAMRHEDARLVVGCMDGAGGDADDGDSRGARGRPVVLCVPPPRVALRCPSFPQDALCVRQEARCGGGPGRAARCARGGSLRFVGELSHGHRRASLSARQL